MMLSGSLHSGSRLGIRDPSRIRFRVRLGLGLEWRLEVYNHSDRTFPVFFADVALGKRGRGEDFQVLAAIASRGSAA